MNAHQIAVNVKYHFKKILSLWIYDFLSVLIVTYATSSAQSLLTFYKNFIVLQNKVYSLAPETVLAIQLYKTSIQWFKVAFFKKCEKKS